MKKVTLFSCWECKERVIKDLPKVKGVEKIEGGSGLTVVSGEFDLDDILKHSDCGNHSSLQSCENVSPPPKPEEVEKVSKEIQKFSLPQHGNNMVIYINNLVVHYHSK